MPLLKKLSKRPNNLFKLMYDGKVNKNQSSARVGLCENLKPMLSCYIHQIKIHLKNKGVFIYSIWLNYLKATLPLLNMVLGQTLLENCTLDSFPLDNCSLDNWSRTIHTSSTQRFYNYFAIAWMFCSRKSKLRLENIQKRAG